MLYFVFLSNLVPDTPHRLNLSRVKPTEVSLSTFLCAPVLSAVVLSYHIFTQSPLQLWQFWNAAFVRCTWKERMRGTRPQRIAVPSALMQALSICCREHVTHAKEALGTAQVIHYTESYMCLCVCAHACTWSVLDESLHRCSAQWSHVQKQIKSEAGSHQLKPPVSTLWFEAPFPSNWVWSAVRYEWWCWFSSRLSPVYVFDLSLSFPAAAWLMLCSSGVQEKWEELDWQVCFVILLAVFLIVRDYREEDGERKWGSGKREKSTGTEMMKRGRGKGTLNHQRSSRTTFTGLLGFLFLAFMHDTDS